MKRLPVGEQSFEKLIRNKSVYVDKTAFIQQLISTGGGYYFLSRPRRFGKSLFLSTIQAFFEGKKELIEGLYIYDKSDWDPHPVILLDMSGFNTSSMGDLRVGMLAGLENIAAGFGIEIDLKEPIAFFARLILKVYEKTNKPVVLLVDEYDKPILDKVDDPLLATEIRGLLQSFYTVIKASAASLRFVMLTGVSKMSQTSVISGLNNLSDITLNKRYAGICGYTQQELEKSFDEHIAKFAKDSRLSKEIIYQEIKKWYNGYSWDGQIFLYNPFSVLKVLE